ncbi:MAG: hypothetical protein H5T33_06240 [Candidatus Methanosuratus sp.]|nr:hypothetical protein [Candidatus Methanosuratincola sp.]
MDLTFPEISGRMYASKVNATLPWQVAFYDPGPPPIVAEALTGTRRWELLQGLVKLMDIRQNLDARTILVSPKRRLGVDDVRLATSFGIYVVLYGDPEGLRLASKGTGVGDVNARAISAILKSKNRRVASECRDAIMSLLKEKWLTHGELVSELQLSFDPGTITHQLRSLTRAGVVQALGRTEKGEGVYGIPEIPYPVRGDLSRASKQRHLKGAIIAALASAGRPLTSYEISERLKVSKHQIRSLLKILSKESKVIRIRHGWALSGEDILT